MKKFLTLTLVLFLSLFIVGELKSETNIERIIGTVEEKIQRGEYSGKRVTVEEIMIKRKVISSHAFEQQYPLGKEVTIHNVVSYEGTLFYCMLYNSDATTVKSGYCSPFTDLRLMNY